MALLEQQVALHYTRPNLENSILDALRAAGKDVERLTTTDLSGADEFHLGWRAATVAFANDMAPAAGTHLLDVGSGLGGPARYFAEVHQCRVTGIDLTHDYVQTAEALTQRCALTDRVSFQQGSALALPFDDQSFDGAYLLHVGMNIANKAQLFQEAHRVLRPGGCFGIYDIMRTSNDVICYPMPWAATAETSFLATLDAYQQLLTEKGFFIETTTQRRDLVLQLWGESDSRPSTSSPPPLGLHVLMGSATPQRLGNVRTGVESGALAPIQLIARAVLRSSSLSRFLRRGRNTHRCNQTKIRLGVSLIEVDNPQIRIGKMGQVPKGRVR